MSIIDFEVCFLDAIGTGCFCFYSINLYLFIDSGYFGGDDGGLLIAVYSIVRLEITTQFLWKPGKFSTWVERGSDGQLKATTGKGRDLVSNHHQLRP